MRILPRFAPILFLLSALAAAPALAARTAQVNASSANVVQSPSAGAKVLEQLPRGSLVTVGNNPSGGYYRVRTRSGTLGFISASSIRVGQASGAPKTQTQQPRRSRRSDDQTFAVEDTGSGAASRGKFQKFRIKGFGTYNLINPQEVSTAYGFEGNALKSAVGGGAEVNYYFKSKWFGTFRLETLKKGVIADDATTGDRFEVDVGSLPVMVGAGYDLLQKKTVSLDAQFLAGVGIGTKLTSVDTSKDEPNITEFSSSPLAFMFKVDFSWKITQLFGVYAEAGYRILKGKEATPSPAGNGSFVFKDAAGNLIALPLNLSGPVFGGGIQFTF